MLFSTTYGTEDATHGQSCTRFLGEAVFRQCFAKLPGSVTKALISVERNCLRWRGRNWMKTGTWCYNWTSS